MLGQTEQQHIIRDGIRGHNRIFLRETEKMNCDTYECKAYTTMAEQQQHYFQRKKKEKNDQKLIKQCEIMCASLYVVGECCICSSFYFILETHTHCKMFPGICHSIESI